MPDSVGHNVACRICMDSKDNCVSLFSHDLSKKFTEVADIQVEKDDGLPETICMECESDLEKCYEFRLKVQVADKKFRENIKFSQVDIVEYNIKQEGYAGDETSENGDDRDSLSMDDDEPDVAQKNQEENDEIEPYPMNHVAVIEQREGKTKMSEDLLNRDQAMIDEPEVGKFEEPALDALTCMKEEAEAEIMDIDNNQLDPFGTSSSMPKTSTRKTERASYSKETLWEALKAIKDDGRKIREVGRSFGIPESTLRKQILSNQPKFPRIGRKAIFSPEVEEDLAKYILKLCKLFYGVTQEQLRRLAFKYAEEHNIPHSFNREKGLAGKDWLYGFLKRHPNISLLQPEATSQNRIAGFNEEEVQLFYTNLEKVLKTHQFPSHRIYNQDETGVSTVQKRCPKVFGPKGVKQIGAATSAERGRTITAIFAMSASGHFLPPMLIYPRTRMTPLLEKNGPPGALYACSANGWSNNEIFMKWLFHFKKHVHPTEDSPVLLILDNHNSHVSIDVYKFCKSNFIHIVSLPPHTSHRLQPLELTFFSPLKNAFYSACDFYLTSTGHTKITEHDVAGLLNKAFEQVAKISNAVSGFKEAGICPFNADKFGDDSFPAAQHDSNDWNIAVEMVDVSDAAASPNQCPRNLSNVNEMDEAPSGNVVVKTSNQSNLADPYVIPIASTSKDC